MMIKSGDERNAVQLLLDSEKWRLAYQMASKTMSQGEIETVFMTKAEEMVEKGHLSTAEELLILCEKEDSAIAMYKKQRKWDDMIRLVTQYHPDLVEKSYQAVAKSLADENSYSQEMITKINAASFSLCKIQEF
jgi:intraflagellar transport protein 172